MSRTWLVTPAFCKWTLLDQCLAHIYQTPLRSDITHVIIDNHYPVNKSYNRRSIQLLAERYGCKYIDSGRDLGLHEGINNAARKLDFRPGDIMVGCDPDDRPTPGFAEKMSDVMRHDHTLAVLAAMFWVIDDRKKQGVFQETRTILKESVLIHPSVEMFTVAAFNWSFIHEIGGMKEPFAYYGGIESYLHERWKIRDMRLGYIESVRADAAAPDRKDPNLFDPEYRTWKTEHVGGYKGSYADWLREFAPGRIEA